MDMSVSNSVFKDLVFISSSKDSLEIGRKHLCFYDGLDYAKI